MLVVLGLHQTASEGIQLRIFIDEIFLLNFEKAYNKIRFDGMPLDTDYSFLGIELIYPI
jgi:hypothetical protein